MNILITGGSKGIGMEAAKALSENKNNKIVITGRDMTALKKAASGSSFGNIHCIGFDLTHLIEKKELFVKQVKEIFNSIDILINNAGYLVNKKFEDYNEKDIRLMMEVNFFAPALLIKTLLSFMHKGSHIVNISSMGGYQGSAKFPGLSCYSASKAAIACLTECLAVELSEKGVSVNCLSPGSVDTEMFQKAFPNLKANLSSKEMGELVAWFAVNGNKYFNGKIIPVSFATP